MVERLRTLLEMIKFSHTIFALPFALLSASLAWQVERFRVSDLVGLLLCMVTARSAAMAFNRLADRHLDAINPRTAGRHLPTDQISTPSVWVFVVVSSLAFVGATLIFLANGNPWPLILSMPVLVFLLAYSFTKRFTVLAHFWLGAALMLAPLAAWIAIRGMTDLTQPAVIGLAVFFWVSGFDIIYACQDADFDRQSGLFSVPAKVGIRNALRISAACHAVTLAFLVALWFVTPYLGWVYLGGVLFVGALLAYEHWLVSPEDLTRVNAAFLLVNSVISVGLLAIVWLQLAVNQVS